MKFNSFSLLLACTSLLLHSKWKMIWKRCKWFLGTEIFFELIVLAKRRECNEKLVVSIFTILFGFLLQTLHCKRESEHTVNDRISERNGTRRTLLLQNGLMFVAQQNLITFYKKSKQTVIIKIWFILSVLLPLFAFCECKPILVLVGIIQMRLFVVVFVVFANSILHFDSINITTIISELSHCEYCGHRQSSTICRAAQVANEMNIE